MVTAAAFAGFLLLGASFAPDAAARVRCSFSPSPHNLLSVTADLGADAQIGRNGRRIVVREYLERPSRCRGGAPTVRNTDTIRILARQDSSVDVLLRHGPFAPGATRERGGAPEIEIKMEFPRRPFVGGFGEVWGTSYADEFHWGRGPANYAGLNLNPGDAGDRDVDITVRGPDTFLVANGRAGNDTIVPAPGAQFPVRSVFSTGGPGDDRLTAPHNSWGILEGGGGDDVLLGGRRGDLVHGGGGHDRLLSDGGKDEIRAGPGRDLIISGPGRDRISSRDIDYDGEERTQRDWVDCGTNRDRVVADRQDRLGGCEVIRRR